MRSLALAACLGERRVGIEPVAVRVVVHHQDRRADVDRAAPAAAGPAAAGQVRHVPRPWKTRPCPGRRRPSCCRWTSTPAAPTPASAVETRRGTRSEGSRRRSSGSAASRQCTSARAASGSSRRADHEDPRTALLPLEDLVEEIEGRKEEERAGDEGDDQEAKRPRVGGRAGERDVGHDEVRVLRRRPAGDDERSLCGGGQARERKTPSNQGPKRGRRGEAGAEVERPGVRPLREAGGDARRAREARREREERDDADDDARRERPRAEVVRELGVSRLVREVHGGEEREERERVHADDDRERREPRREEAARDDAALDADVARRDRAHEVTEDDGRGDAGKREEEAPAPLLRVAAEVVRAEGERRAAEHDADEEQRDRDVERDRDRRKRCGKRGKKENDAEDQPDVVRLPDRAEGLLDERRAARRLHGQRREEIPDAAAEVGAGDEHVEDERPRASRPPSIRLKHGVTAAITPLGRAGRPRWARHGAGARGGR